MGQGRGGTELGQGIVAARTQGNIGFVVEVPSETSLELSSSLDGCQFRVLVHSGLGNDEGSGTTKFIPVLNAYHAPFVAC